MLWILAASAAEVTEIPGPIGGSIELQYRGQLQFGGLVEGTERIAERRVQEHHLDATLEFSPFRGAALVLGLEAAPSWMWTYPEARQMLLEPVDGGGSYLFSTPDPEAEPYTVKGGGLTGFWIGAAFAPFSERLFAKQKVSWRVDFAVRPGNKKSNRWTVRDGKRGAGPGTTGIRVAGAFSRRGGVAEPYVRMRLQHEGKTEIELADEQGVRNPTFVVDPASTVELIGGTGVLASKLQKDPSYFDVHLGAIYRSWEDVPSGMYLPNVIEASKAIPITHSESFTGVFGLGANLAFGSNVSADLGVEAAYTIPHRQEHLFDVTTSPDTIGINWHVALKGTLEKADLDK